MILDHMIFLAYLFRCICAHEIPILPTHISYHDMALDHPMIRQLFIPWFALLDIGVVKGSAQCSMLYMPH
jgi:hypothetical protein